MTRRLPSAWTSARSRVSNQPSVAEHLGGPLRVLVVAAHDVGPADLQAADVARAARAAAFVGETMLHAADHVAGGPQHAVMGISHGDHDDGLRHAVALQQGHAGGVEELVHGVGQRTAADAGKAQAAAEPGPDLTEDQAVGQRVEGGERDDLRPRRRAPHRPADPAVRPDLRLAALERPPRARERERAGHQPARQPPARRLQAVDPQEHALVELDPQLRHGGHHHRAHRRQVAAQVQDVAVVHAASLAQVHELHLTLEGVPRLQQREHRLALDVQQVGELAQVELVVGVGERHALGGAGRARRVDDRRQVVGLHLRAPPLDLRGRLRPLRLAELRQLGQGEHRAGAVAGGAARSGRRARRSRRLAGRLRGVDDDRRPQPGQRLAHVRQLRRVLHDDHGGLRVAQDGLEDLGRRVRRAGHVHGADEVDGEAADQPLGTVVADRGRRARRGARRASARARARARSRAGRAPRS